MYDNDLEVSIPQKRNRAHTLPGPTARRPACLNISGAIVLLYGDSDSLVDINLLSKELPVTTAIPLRVSVNITLNHGHDE